MRLSTFCGLHRDTEHLQVFIFKNSLKSSKYQGLMIFYLSLKQEKNQKICCKKSHFVD
jgi:hypothetical protein